MENEKIPRDIDEYISYYPVDIQEIMCKVRQVIHENATGVTEGLSWAMPTFKIKKILVQFAAHKNHLGFYPYPETIEHFSDKLTGYKTSKGGIQFNYNKPMPYDLIGEIVRYKTERLQNK